MKTEKANYNYLMFYFKSFVKLVLYLNSEIEKYFELKYPVFVFVI
jgi:hypothetical protein